MEVYRRAEAKLFIVWPSQQVIERNLCDGKWLPSCLILVKQFTPAFLAYIVEMKRHWDKPYSHYVPVKGFVWLDIQDMGNGS